MSQNALKTRMDIAYWRKKPLLLTSLLLLAGGLILHFAGLSRINTLVFDEVYYAKYGHAYFHGQPVFDVHPPLGKYLIGIGMWIGDAIGYAGYATNTLSGAARAPWSYRWVDALFGSLLPLLTFGLTWQLTRQLRSAVLAGVFMLCSGLFLVEARYGLINVFMIAFGLAGHWLWLRALDATTPRQRHLHYALAGIALGASISIKWNALVFLAAVWSMTALAWLLKWRGFPSAARFAALRPAPFAAYFLALPLLVYAVQWVPHLRINNAQFVDLHKQMAGFHKNMKDGPSEHPYCSRWYTWPMQLRPINYLYEQSRSANDPLPPYAEKVPQDQTKAVYVAHALVNPLLAWWSCVALVGLAGLAVWRTARPRVPAATPSENPENLWAIGYVLLSFLGGWLPWAFIGRCQFVYLYMPSLAFAVIAAAIAAAWLLAKSAALWQNAGYVVITVVTLCFLYFLPIYLALPISPSGFYARMWLRSWI
jgi:dolichyl-phosphate-mannose--protein O-mannosyl transferase